MKFTEDMKAKLYAWMKKKMITKSKLSAMLGHATNYINDCEARGRINDDVWDAILQSMSADEVKEIKTMDMLSFNERAEKTVYDLPFSDKDYITPRRADVDCTIWQPANGKQAFKFNFTPECFKRIDTHFIRLAEKNGRVYFIPSAKGVTGCFEATDLAKGGAMISIDQEECIERLKKYIGAHRVEFDDILEVFYMEQK